MTKEQLQFVSDNKQHFALVIEHAQNFQRSHDITGQVIAIAEEITSKPVDHCTACVTQAYKDVWDKYQEESKPAKEKK